MVLREFQFVYRVRIPLLAAMSVLGLAACAPTSQIEVAAALPAPALQQPVRYVEMFPGESKGCGFPNRDVKVWNTHPVRMINASFSKPADNGDVDYFSLNIPAGKVMTVQTCSGDGTNLIDARFIDHQS